MLALKNKIQLSTFEGLIGFIKRFINWAISSGKQILWSYTTWKAFIVRRAGQGKEVISKGKMKVHWRKIKFQMRTASHWLNRGIFPLAGRVAGQRGSLPSSCWGSKVLSLTVWECKVYLFLLGVSKVTSFLG